MPYLLILLGTILISIGIWMLQKPKATRQPVPIETVEHSKPESIQTVDPSKEEAQPSNKEKGNAFEKFVVSKFNRNYFSIKQWQGDKFHEGRFAEANQHQSGVALIGRGSSHVRTIHKPLAYITNLLPEKNGNNFVVYEKGV
jgi:hypothetical protein